MKGLLADAAIVGRLLRGMPRRGDQQQRLEGFYGAQAEGYDAFRERLLHGRQELIEHIDPRPDQRVAELGGGTGSNLDLLGERIHDLAEVHVVDLCRPLLAVAERRVAARGWQGVHLHHADVCAWRPQRPLDAVWFSYCLTMVPDWFAAIDNALACLRPGGRIGVVDFHISRANPAPGLVRHSAFSRWFWPRWFGHDGVRLNPDLLPFLLRRTRPLHLAESRGSVPWLPGMRVPYLVYVGEKG